MSEHDANRALLNTARLRIVDPLEETQRMPVYQRRQHQNEAKQQYADGIVDDAVREHGYHIAVDVPAGPGRMSPVVTLTYRDFREGDHKYRLSAHEIAQQDGFPDNE